MGELTVAYDNLCDGDCGGILGRGWRMCLTGDCFLTLCAICADEHDLRVHIGPKEQSVLAQWKEQAQAKREQE